MTIERNMANLINSRNLICTHIIQASDLSQSLIIPLRYEVGLLIGRWLVVPAADIIIHLVWFCVLVWTEEGCFMIKNYLLYILSIESRSYGVFPRRSHLKNRVFLIKTEQSTLEILEWTYHKYWKVFFYIIKEYTQNIPQSMYFNKSLVFSTPWHHYLALTLSTQGWLLLSPVKCFR